MLMAGTSAAYAGEGDVFTPYVGYGVYHDDNLSRQPDSGNRQSDTWYKTTAGLRIDKTLSRQRLTANLSINDTKFDRFSQLDNDGRQIGANWGWVIGNHLDGNIGYSENRQLTPFGQIDPTNPRPIAPAVRTQKRTYIDGGYRFHPAWRVRGSFNHYDISFDTGSGSDFQLDESEVGIDYLSRAQNKIGLLFRHSTADYRVGSLFDYDQDELKTNVSWRITGKTDLQFLGGWAKRNYQSDANDRDYSGFDARLTANWAATGKTRFSLAAYRELGSGIGDPELALLDPANSYYSNYSRNTGVSLSANWQATAKIVVDAGIQRETRSYNGIITSLSDRSDTYRRNTIGVTFLPLRQLSIRASVYQQYLDSNIEGRSYSNKGFLVTTRYEF